MYQPNLFRGLIAMIAANNGRIDNRIRIQKTAYLLKRLGIGDFRAANFRYHHYGPYSRELSDVLNAAVAAGLLREQQTEHEAGVGYNYELTEEGKKWVKENLDEPEMKVKHYVPRFDQETWRTLELASTVLFLENEIQTTRDNAFHRALELKPQCAQYHFQTKKLLAELAL